MKNSIPVVFFNEVRGTGITIGGEQWIDWLIEQASFRYECAEGSFTARRYGDYWNAYRKRFTKLRQEYLGKSHDLACDRLVKIAKLMATSDTFYWQFKAERKRERVMSYRQDNSITPSSKSRSYREDISITTPYRFGVTHQEMLELQQNL